MGRGPRRGRMLLGQGAERRGGDGRPASRGDRRLRCRRVAGRPPAPRRGEPGALHRHAGSAAACGARARPAHGGGPARGRVRLGRHRPLEGAGRPRMSRMLAVVGLTVLSGCTVSLGRTGLIADVVPMKLLRPGVVGRSCRASVLGVPFRAGPPTVAEALAEMLAKDPEGNVVTHAEMTWSEAV